MTTRFVLKVTIFMVLTAALCAPVRAVTPEERRAYLKKLAAILPPSPQWTEWLNRSGELPPDFDSLPAQAALPDPLVRTSGGRPAPVRSTAEWDERRIEIKKLFEQYVIGSMPPRPSNLRATVLTTERQHRASVRRVRLEFGPDHKGKLDVELFVPDGPGPFPVLLGPVRIRSWALIALRRGYLCALYAGSDSLDDADALAQVYPDYDFALIARRAWAGHRVLDYLETLPEADMKRVGITGHSRDGKQALISAAFDERISAVIVSSSGVGGMVPYRYSGEKYSDEGVEWMTRVFPKWYHPRLRFFTGREQHLPVDANLLVALVAPRACLLASALNDWVDSAWAVERTYLSALEAYRLLGRPEKLGIRWRFNLHSVHARDIEEYLDWFDIQFGRSKRRWETELLYGYDFDQWRRQSGETVDPARYPRRGLSGLDRGDDHKPLASPQAWEAKAAAVRRNVEWALGERPAAIEVGRNPRPRATGQAMRGLQPPVGLRLTILDDLPPIAMSMGSHFGWRKPQSEKVRVQSVPFGDNLRGDLYYPLETDGAQRRLPLVLWLHGFGHAMGYQWSARSDLNPILALCERGYAVFAFDQLGFGTRILEAGRFYDRYPRWSQMGKMVDDAKAAVDAVEGLPFIDSKSISAFGYSIGGTVAIYAAALDPRISAVVSICGFTPMRLDTAGKGTEGAGRFGRLHGYLPRLGFFVGSEDRIPYDFHEMLAALAPRPVLVMAPEQDRDATLADVRLAVEEARKIYSLYGAAERIALYSPWDYNRLPEKHQEWVIGWLHERTSSARRPDLNQAAGEVAAALIERTQEHARAASTTRKAK